MNDMSQSSSVLSLAWTNDHRDSKDQNLMPLLGIFWILLRIRKDQLSTWALISAHLPPICKRQNPAHTSARAQIQRKVVQIWKGCRYTHSLWWIKQVQTYLCAWSWGWELNGFIVICKKKTMTNDILGSTCLFLVPSGLTAYWLIYQKQQLSAVERVSESEIFVLSMQ